MAITRAQQVRQMYRTAGAVQAAYGKSAAKSGPVEYDTGLERQRTENVFNEIKPKNELDVNEVLTKASDVNRIKNAVTGGGLKSLISPQMIIGKLIIDQITKDRDGNQTIVQPAFADGGDVVGGEMDFESARQMYGLGKLVKKVTRAVKKVVKSPIGKAALLYAGGAGLGALGTGTGFAGFKAGLMSPTTLFGNLKTTFGKGSFNPFLRKVGTDADPFFSPFGEFASKLGIVNKSGIPSIGTAITAASLVGGALTAAQEEEAQQLADTTGIDIDAARRSILARAEGNIEDDVRMLSARADGGIMRAGYQEGSKEPVAKKTMPLLDMGGKEMDLREDGGFVPLGRMERADDVPARLSKNEFVFTADAVRNAGEGDVDKGAEVMYNMMKNLESGGDVSEESQGLEGARRMFQTSQRLEEVI
jgi:hypothetical protein